MMREEAIEYLQTIRMKECAEFEPIGTWYKGIEDKYNTAIRVGIEALEQQPEWIPVDQDKYPEGYPKPFQEVWVTDDYGEVVHCCYGGKRKIKAWMPFVTPEPYKESEDKG